MEGEGRTARGFQRARATPTSGNKQPQRAPRSFAAAAAPPDDARGRGRKGEVALATGRGTDDGSLVGVM